MNPRIRILAALVAALSLSFGALAAVNVELNGVTTTTSTAATGQATGGARRAIVQVWQADTHSGTSTVLVEERASGGTGKEAPWITVATFTDCDEDGLGTVTVDGTTAAGPCKMQTLTSSAYTRLRVSACAACKMHGVIEDVR